MRARFLSESRATMIRPILNCRPPRGSQNCDTVIDFTAYECLVSPLGCKRLEGQLRVRARFLSESRATMIHPTLNCRPPWGSQNCDTVIDFTAYECLVSPLGRKRLEGQLRMGARFFSEFWAAMIHPTLNCRPPWGSQKCDTVIEFTACECLVSPLGRKRFQGQLRMGARFLSESRATMI